jgi:hypothetical protein
VPATLQKQHTLKLRDQLRPVERIAKPIVNAVVVAKLDQVFGEEKGVADKLGAPRPQHIAKHADQLRCPMDIEDRSKILPRIREVEDIIR